ncbi:fimbria/pilus periplasmic chaperone [Vibrio sp. TH_r3]|uniref:fimbria/pilus periplasmic chaperone n=1 Tax=Vibrio sp. TH_r3 TaxID=3082084 RepID=UPI0029529A1B|nr:fimbria/pilus periplasmic chaperone [Vibrio sp. TH_r3]MDV7105861.1 fimbria/pilus periplasmic chaperone [Vibrio sp. TH_r3]
MNKNRPIVLILLGLTISVSFSAHSALVLMGTRFIYNESDRAIPVAVQNYADTAYGAQFWIENTEDTATIPFSVTPSVFTIKPNGGKQVVQVSKLDDDSFKKDRESLFTINVQEIPPVPEDDSLSGNVLVMASRIIVKMMYRPKSIEDGRDRAEEQVNIKRQGEAWVFKNPTPYYFAFMSINNDPSLATKALNRMAPFSQTQIVLPNTSVSTKNVKFSAIDDFGGVRQYSCDVTKNQNQCLWLKETE